MLFINKILPVFLVILLGWFSAKVKLVDKSIASALLSFAVFPLVPALVFLATSQIQINDLLHYRLWISYILVSLLITLLTFLVLYIFFHQKILIATIGSLFTSISNTALIGLPIAMSILGKRSVIVFTISLIVAFFLFIPIFIVVLDLLKNKKISIFGCLALIFKNPIIISIILGLLFSLFSVALPVYIKGLLEYFSQALIATALFAVGLTIHGAKMSQDWGQVVCISISCLFLKPLIAYIIGISFGLSNFLLASLVLFNSVPSAKILFIFASKSNVYENRAAGIISLTTLCSIISIPIVIYLFNTMHPGVFLGT